MADKPDAETLITAKLIAQAKKRRDPLYRDLVTAVALRTGRPPDDIEQELAETTDRVRVLCCGPEPMMECVAQICSRVGVACEVSLETPMACGIGICFSCVARVRHGDGSWDYKRTCVDGPVFDAEKLVW